MSAVTKHVYHYSATRNTGAYTTTYDGILYCDSPVINLKRYQDVKQAIVGEGANTESLMIASLSYFGQQLVSSLGPGTALLDAAPHTPQGGDK